MGINQKPATLNKYIYGESDPVNNIDPSGNFSLAGFGTVSNIQRVLATASTPAVNIGVSFLANTSGQIVGIATTTCAASIAGTRFGIIEPIAEFSKKCDGTSHRGRWQAQGGGLEESENWSQSHPLTLTEGLTLLDTLKNKLKPKDRNARLPYFEKARLFAIRQSALGGIAARDFGTSKSFPTNGSPEDPRVDLEIRSGRAFVGN